MKINIWATKSSCGCWMVTNDQISVFILMCVNVNCSTSLIASRSQCVALFLWNTGSKIGENVEKKKETSHITFHCFRCLINTIVLSFSPKVILVVMSRCASLWLLWHPFVSWSVSTVFFYNASKNEVFFEAVLIDSSLYHRSFLISTFPYTALCHLLSAGADASDRSFERCYRSNHTSSAVHR